MIPVWQHQLIQARYICAFANKNFSNRWDILQATKGRNSFDKI